MIWEYKFKLGASKEPIVITGTSFDDVFQKTADEFKRRNLSYHAESLRDGINRQNDKAARSKSKRIKLADAIRGANAIIRYAAGVSTTNTEILRRSSICSGCFELSEVSDCMSCGGSGKLVNFVNTIRSSKGKEVAIPDGIKNKYCGICQCAIPSLVVTKYSDIKPESEPKQQLRPIHCWLKKTSPNYKDEA